MRMLSSDSNIDRYIYMYKTGFISGFDIRMGKRSVANLKRGRRNWLEGYSYKIGRSDRQLQGEHAGAKGGGGVPPWSPPP